MYCLLCIIFKHSKKNRRFHNSLHVNCPFQETFYQLHGWHSNLVTLIRQSLTSHVIILTPIQAQILTSDPYNCWPLLLRKSVLCAIEWTGSFCQGYWQLNAQSMAFHFLPKKLFIIAKLRLHQELTSSFSTIFDEFCQKLPYFGRNVWKFEKKTWRIFMEI